MGARSVTGVAAAAAAVVFTIIMVPIIVLAGGNSSANASTAQNAANTGGTCVYTPAKSGGATVARIKLNATQLQLAGVGVAVAKQRGLPAQASIDVIATGMQESQLGLLTTGNLDSIGWLQQRPSQGWGTVAQLQDPAYQAAKFFDALVKVPNWQTIDADTAIQDVQISGTPLAYAKWIPMATALAAQLLGDPSVALTCSGGGGGGGGGAIPPAQAPTAAIGTVLARAKAQLGAQYCYNAGTASGPTHGDGNDGHGSGCGDPSIIGYDCSGLTLYAWAGAGITLPHNSGAQYEVNIGKLVPITQTQPGDLVFLSSNGTVAGIHHVAMIWSTNGKPDGSGSTIEAYNWNKPLHITTWAGADERQVMPMARHLDP